jgi:hypothetical protein
MVMSDFRAFQNFASSSCGVGMGSPGAECVKLKAAKGVPSFDRCPLGQVEELMDTLDENASVISAGKVTGTSVYNTDGDLLGEFMT